jgi:nicotinate-nucleotide pyrophosphorylase (carboxylating)
MCYGYRADRHTGIADPDVATGHEPMNMELPQTAIARIVQTALDEDMGRGDITTDACLDAGARGRAQVRARRPLVFCGLDVLREVFRQVDPGIEVERLCEEGQQLQAGEAAAEISGRSASILKGERVALNFLQRLSGIATLARAFVDRLPPGSRTRITDTRKTTPGLRLLERYAVRCGGAHNHREDPASAVLIKDNHIAACGGIGRAIRRAHERAPHTSRITCEVDDVPGVIEALEAGADVILLDNFHNGLLADAVKEVAGRALVEVSGGVTLDRVTVIAEAGADVISVGALTHSAPAADLGMDWVAEPRNDANGLRD